MGIQALTLNEQQPKQRKNISTIPAALLGAAVGSAARYVVPTKAESRSLFNKNNFDTFISSAATKARGANRSILASAAIGAAFAAGAAAIVNKIKNPNPPKDENVEYTKLGALIDAAPYACEILWYEA